MGLLFEHDGQWYKGNLHTHTTNSDGHKAPEEVLKIYREAGYDFIALTDHWVHGEAGVRDGLLVIAGCEFDTGDMVNDPIYHIIGVGMERRVSLTRCPSRHPQELIDAIRAAGGIAILAHPKWSLTDPVASAALTGLAGAEVYNTVSGLPWNGDRAESSLYFDLWAAQGRLMPCMAADDAHFYTGEQTRSYIMVKAKELTEKAVKEAILAGDFYASQGPVFKAVDVGQRSIEVTCSEVETVVFYSNTVWCGDRVTTGGVTAASYAIQPTDHYVRIELIGKSGEKAWSSPIPVNR